MPRKNELPPSREVRLQDGVTHGYLEDLLYQAHTGPTSGLIPLMARAELEVQLERSHAAEDIHARLLGHLTLSGYLSSSEIDSILRQWHEDEVMYNPDQLRLA